MTQETATQNAMKQLQPSIPNKKAEELSMHGQFYRDLENPSVDKDKPLAWLCSSGLKGEMESSTTAAQYPALNTCYHQRNMKKQSVGSKRRVCYNGEEHIKHTVAGCTTLAPPEYANRHSKVAGYIP
jgi:hypothetical protein